MKTNRNYLTLAVFLAATMSSLGQPAITQQPTNQLPYVGGTATFRVIATGAPPPTYHWRFNGTDLPGKTNSTLSLAALKFTNAGPYSVMVSNDGGPVMSQTAWLSVLPTNVVNLGDRELQFGQPSPPIWAAARIDDEGQSITGDGLTLFYSSSAPGGSGDKDIWRVTRPTLASSNWSAPVNLGPNVNSPSYDSDPVLSPNGLSLYFTSARPDGSGGYDLWVATRPAREATFAPAVNLGTAINSTANDGSAQVSADNLTLVFTSDRSGGLGHLDIWMSTRTNASAPWAAAVHLPAPFNVSAAYNFPVALSRDGLTMFFKSNRDIPVGPSAAGMYVTRRRSADQPFGTPVLIRPILGLGSGGVDYSSLSDDGQTLWVGTYLTAYPDWPQVVQVSITELPKLNALGEVAAGDFQLELLGRAGATYEMQVAPDFNVWSPWLTTNTAGSVKLSDPTPAPEGRRFYRALSH